jgi:hypothetical protein
MFTNRNANLTLFSIKLYTLVWFGRFKFELSILYG